MAVYPTRDAPVVLERLFWLLGAPKGFHEIRWWPSEGGGVQRHDVRVDELERFVGLIEYLGETEQVELSMVPRPSRGWGTVGKAHLLWCRSESLRQLEKLRRLKPRPTMVLREGQTVRHLAIWDLSVTLPYDYVVRGNRRLAHAIGAPKKYAEPEELFVPAGTCLREGRRRPVPIVHAGGSSRVFHPDEVVGHLREAPDPDAWRKAAAG